MTQIWLFAAAYGAGAYGDGTYNNGVTADDGSGSGQLVRTGVVIAGVVTATCLITFVALLVRFWKRKKQAHYLRVR